MCRHHCPLHVPLPLPSLCHCHHPLHTTTITLSIPPSLLSLCHCHHPPMSPCHLVIHRPQMPPYSPPLGAPHLTLLPSACPHVLYTSPVHPYMPSGSDCPHSQPTLPPSHPGGSHAPLTCYCLHKCVNLPTDASHPSQTHSGPYLE